MPTKSTFNFLSLPLEVPSSHLRLPPHEPVHHRRDPQRQSTVLLWKADFPGSDSPAGSVWSPQTKAIHPAILRTCKQIHKEAASTLYAENSFSTHSSTYMLRFFKQIGPSNVKHIKELNLILPWTASSHLQYWLLLLKVLAREATGLKHLAVAWLAECWSPMQMRRGARGIGDNVASVRALARVTQVSDLFIGGFYANWLAFLKREMEDHGVNVMAEAGEFAAMLQGGLGELFSSRVEEFQRGM